MATLEASFPLKHDSDADFRVWAKALFDALIQVGGGMLTQTTDAGQIDFATAVRPAVSTRPFFVLKFEDGLGRPLFLRFEVGTAGIITHPITRLIIGTGTNGAGDLTGALITQSVSNPNRIPLAGNHLSYLCVLPGYISISLGKDYLVPGTWLTQVAVARHQSLDGVPEDTGYHALLSTGPVIGTATTMSMYTVNFDGLPASVDANYWAIVPFGKTDMLVEGKVYCLPAWYQSDRPRICNFLAITGLANVAIGSDISLRTLEVTPRNFRNTGLRPPGAVNANQYVVLGMWE